MKLGGPQFDPIPQQKGKAAGTKPLDAVMNGSEDVIANGLSPFTPLLSFILC